MHVDICFDWLEVGTVKFDGGLLRFPAVGYIPGIYSFDLGDRRIYIGEADRLQRRFQHYRTPGGSPDTLRPNTNRRVNRAIARRLEVGETRVSICTDAEIIHETRRSTLDSVARPRASSSKASP